MPKYEAVVVLHSGIAPTDVEAILERFEQTIARHGGSVSLKEPWGQRPLAYPIQKQSSGEYHRFRFEADSAVVDDADREFRLDDKVLRHLIVIDEEWEEKNRSALAKRAEQAAARAEGGSRGQ